MPRAADPDAFADWSALRVDPAGHGLAVYPAGSSFGPRRLGDWEFVWIVEGEAEWTVDGVAHPAPPGTVTLARPGMVDGYRWDQRRDSRHGFVHFSLGLEGVRCPPPESWPLLRRCDADSVVQPLLKSCIRALDERGPGWRELACGALRHALLAFVAGGGAVAGDEPPTPPAAVARALVRLREAWDGSEAWTPLSISALARAAGVSREHLARAFQRHFGTSPRAAQLALRLDRAAHLLARTDLTVNEVGRLAGFADQFHFSRRFSAAYGASPRAFRKRIAAGAPLPQHPLVRVWQVRSGVFG